MNRIEEYETLLKELDQTIPKAEATIERAYQRKKKRNRIVRPIASFATCFAIFVLLVNFCTPVALACSQIPILRELAETVTFSKSLSDAVKNEYVQTIDLSQTNGTITAKIEYLIVDQKQVNIFYRLDSKEYTQLMTDPEILSEDGTRQESCSYGSREFNTKNGELRTLNIEFVDDDVPNKLRVKLNIYDNGITPSTPTTNVDDSIFSDDVYKEPDYLAEFDFLLEFDPQFTASGKIFSVNQTLELEGQFITITDIEVYPTHMRVNIAEATDNTAWLKNLNFYIEIDSGRKFEPVSNGISAIGSEDSPSMVSYRAESTYFYEADTLNLVITGAKWLKKDRETMYLNLLTGETDFLPEGVEFDSAIKEEEGWIVTFRARYEKIMCQIFGHLYYDKNGTEYEINAWRNNHDTSVKDSTVTYYFEQFSLRNYSYDEVWLSPLFSHTWTTKEPIVIPIQ